MKKGEKFVYFLQGNLYINLTNKCCNDCSFCLRRNGDGIKGDTLWLSREPSGEEVIELIKNVERDFTEAVFCGYGEPTYKPDEITAIARYLKGAGKRTRLNTNGLGNAINGRDIVPQFVDCIDKMSISLNESDPERYNSLCKPVYGNEAYGYIIDFAKECAEKGIDTVLTVVDVIPPEEIEKCKQVAASAGVRLRIRKHITNNTDYT